MRPMTFSWPIEIVQDLRRLISLDTFSQLGQASDDAHQQRDHFPAAGGVIWWASAFTHADISHPLP